jgi:hypothetical protein
MTSFRRISLVAMILFFSAMLCNLFAWDIDQDISNNTRADSTPFNNAHGIAIRGDTIMIGYHQAGFYADPEPYVIGSLNGGSSWSPYNIQGAALYNPSQNVAVAVRDNYFHAAWQDSHPGNYEIYYNRNESGSWNNKTVMTQDDNQHSWAPCIQHSGDYVHLVWCDEKDGSGNPEIMYMRSTNNGTAWQDTIQLTSTSSGDSNMYPSISAAGSYVDVAYMSNKDGDWEIYHRRSTNNGSSWGNENQVTNQAATQVHPNIAISSGGIISIAWEDNRNRNWDIYVARSKYGGSTWTRVQQCTGQGDQFHPSLAFVGTNLHIVWNDGYVVRHMVSHNSGYCFEDTFTITDDGAKAKRPSIAVWREGEEDSVTVCATWCDEQSPTEDDWDIYFDKYRYAYGVTYEPEGGGGELISNPSEQIFSDIVYSSPNPMRNHTTIKFSTSSRRVISLGIYDISGRLIKPLYNGELNSGSYSIQWNGENLEGKPVNPGIYVLKAENCKPAKLIKLE